MLNARPFAALMLLAVTCLGATAQSDRALVDRFDRADAQRQFERGLAAAETITERYPDATHWKINTARMLAQLGRTNEAIAQIQQAADKNYTGVRTVEQHADLDPLRSLPAFTAALDQIRANAKARLDEFIVEARAHKPPTLTPQSTDPDRKPALVIALHGTGGTGEQMLRALRTSCEQVGVVCVAPDALRPAGDGFSWTYRDESEWMVTHIIEQAIAEHGVDPDRVILVGFSQGANIALTMARTHADQIAAVVPIAGHYEPEAVAAGRAVAPHYLLIGSRDPWHETYERGAEDMQAHGIPHEMRLLSGLGHEMPGEQELIRALNWCLGQLED